MKNYRARYFTREFHFRFKAKTSRNTLTQKTSWFITLHHGNLVGIGEASPIWGLSPESRESFTSKIEEVVANPSTFLADPSQLDPYPSIRFALETALKGLHSVTPFALNATPWSRGECGQKINGLVWMGDLDFMTEQVRKKLDAGFTCLKLKVGALDAEIELGILAEIRKSFSPSDLEIRLDANGAFATSEAPAKLQSFSRFTIHSIEQPIKPGLWEDLSALCRRSPIPIALDEELIGITSEKVKIDLLETIKPAYIILKPSLLGGTASCDAWIALAQEKNIGWWATSMLESDVGLNAIAQWVSTYTPSLPQGLGTGQLYNNNIPSPLEVRSDELWYGSESLWEVPKDWIEQNSSE